VPKFRISIIAVLVFGSAGTTLVAVALVLYLGFSSAIENTQNLLYQSAERTIDSLIKDISNDLDPVYFHAQSLSNRTLSGDLDPRQEDDWQKTIAELPRTLPQVASAAFIGPDLQGVIYLADDETVLRRDFSMLPQATKLFSTIEEDREPRWLRPLWSPIIHKSIVAIAAPLYRIDEFLGIHVAVINLDDFSERLARNLEGTGLTPFVIYENNWLLLHPAITNWSPAPELIAMESVFGQTGFNVVLPDLESLPREKISRFWEAKIVPLEEAGLTGETRITRFEENGQTELFLYRKVKKFGDRNLIVGAHFDRSQLEPEFKRLRNYGLLGVLVLGLSVLAALTLGGLTAKPIRRLANATRIARGDNLDEVPILEQSTIRELDDAAASFNEMIVGLRERARIRNLFGKYVPPSIAKKLIEDEGGLEPLNAEATVLFVDLEGFTSLSERLEPQMIAELLNEYFSAMVAVIRRHNGIVTQFQGDAILAIFNIPIADPEHQNNAVRAAVEMLEIVTSTKFAGHQLAIRVGINTGEVFAGNVGADDRLNYTVHGDAVNIAARIEAMNKESGTRILVGEPTAKGVTSVALKRLPDVSIRGKEQSVGLYAVADND